MFTSRVLHGLGAVILAAMLAACAAQDGHRSAGQYTDDTATTARVKAALVQADGVSAADVQVETYGGVVQLSGFVPSQDAATQAVNAARGVDGVKEVRNDIQVRGRQ
ncbi:BON domain-containing protein [Bordetella sp. BOR01]|uniref:BON domain-containing protein n=1 Tax=Bordetella sp. BOR01 TaxID=2854779 RepID=UPI001C43CF8B|nr:BON domain-containing protein [Bordetella sp. BOR01]MBV7486149.1 BON domain-containing protein [Bordetella sp. BOR01]